MTATKPLRILLADDHAMVRRGFRLILAQHPGEFDVAGEAGNGQQTLDMVKELQPDVVLLDVAMPQMNGVEVTQQISRNWPHVKVIMLSMHRDATYVRESLRAGAKGYVLKESVDGELLRAVRTVADGDAYFAPGVSNVVLTDYQQFVGSPLDLLTRRELDISVYTVDAHRNRIFRKLQLRSSSDLVRFALRQGLISG